MSAPAARGRGATGLARDARLLRRPLWRPLLQTAANLALYGAAVAFVTAEGLGPWRLAAWPFMGLMLAGFLAAAHDCFHNTHLDSKLANRVAGALWCAPILTNFTATKTAHMVHHRYTRVEGDSEPTFHAQTLGAYARTLFPLHALPRAVLKAFRVLTGQMRPPHAKTPRALRDARIDAAVILTWVAVAFALTLWWPETMVLAYWAPLAFFLPMAVAIAMPEHHGCGEGPAVLDVTRTTKSNWLARFILWNSNYHVEHHLQPAVPSCNLPALHRAVRDELPCLSPNYLSFHFSVLRGLLRARRRHADKAPAA